MLLSYKPLHLEAQQRLQEEGCVVDINRLVASLTSTPSLLDCICSKNDPREGFIPFDIPFRRNIEIGKKQQIALGLRLIG